MLTWVFKQLWNAALHAEFGHFGQFSSHYIVHATISHFPAVKNQAHSKRVSFDFTHAVNEPVLQINVFNLKKCMQPSLNDQTHY